MAQFRLMLAVGVSASALTVYGGALAQTPVPVESANGSAPPPAAASAAEIVVTGSRIRGVAPVGSSIVSLSRDDIVQSGAVSTAAVIQQVPQVFNLGVSESSRGQSGGSGNITYGTSINLRGIGPYATLTLLDGHRAVPQGTSGQSIDPSVVPTLMLQRVEIIADGASAIYGSDAVAGVVNLIMRRGFEGVEAMARYGGGDSYDERQFGVIMGHKWSGGQFTMAYENGYHSALSGKDRDFYRGDLASEGGGDYRVTQCNPGTITAGGVNYAIPAGGVTAANASALVAGTSNRCDNLKTADLAPRQNRNSVAFTFNQDINDRVSIFADGFANKREFKFRPSVLSGSLTVPSTNPYYVRPPGAAAGTSETVGYSFGNDLPANTSEGFSKAYEATLGADIKLGGDWKLEADYTFGRDDDLSISDQGINNGALNAALASSNPATAFDPFAPNANNAAIAKKFANSLFYAPGRTILQTYEAKVDGSLFQLPGGVVRAAAGFEGQRTSVDTGLTNGTVTAPISSRLFLGRTVTSLYGELLVPIIGSGNALPFVRSLDLDLAGRFDQYSDVGTTTNPKVGLNWSPIEGLTLRGSFGTSFRAPLLNQLHASTQALYVQNYSDPTLGGAIRQGLTLSGGNPNLTPETATTYSVGGDWSPSFLPRARFSLTYFNIEYKNQVTSYLSDLTILNRESQFAGTNIIQRNPSAAFISSLTSQYAVNGVLPANVTLFVDGRSNNLGVTQADGFDFEASYRFPTDNWGDFSFGVNGTYFTDYKVAITPTAPLLDVLNTIYNPLRFKARGSVSWTKGPVLATVFVNYENGYTNNLANPVQRVDAYAPIDLHLAYKMDSHWLNGWAKGTTLALDVTNVFDQDPPFVNIAESPNGGGGFDATLTNPVGRIISFSIDKSF